MNQPVRESRCVFFADVCESSRLFEQFGDAAARRIVRQLLDDCAHSVRGNEGEVIKTVGDELMASFADTRSAIAAARDLLRESDSGVAGPAPGLRMGLHFGEVLMEAGDLFGSTVNTAARMVAMARCGQLVATAASLYGSSSSMRGLRRRSLGEHSLPGLSQAIDVVEIVWEGAEASTSISTRPSPANAARDSMLILRRGEREIVLSAGCEPLRLGRDAAADLVVDAHWVSRLHALIEYRRGFFLLRDVSTNGTFVFLEGADRVALHRNELTLRGSGRISLGREPARDPGPALHFRCS